MHTNKRNGHDVALPEHAIEARNKDVTNITSADEVALMRESPMGHFWPRDEMDRCDIPYGITDLEESEDAFGTICSGAVKDSRSAT